MGILSKIGDFLFGKGPDIFDERGEVTHKLPKRTWDAWNHRIKMNPEYNWRDHVGMRAGSENASKETQPNQTKN